MKQYLLIVSIIFGLLFSCNSNKVIGENDQPKLENDTIRIANAAIEYDVTIIDPGFRNWFNSNARPRGFYSQSYLESRNRVWVTEWNRRVLLPQQYNPNWYEMQINYDLFTDYGYEVNYMIYNYFIYFQLTNNQRLGGFTPRR